MYIRSHGLRSPEVYTKYDLRFKDVSSLNYLAQIRTDAINLEESRRSERLSGGSLTVATRKRPTVEKETVFVYQYFYDKLKTRRLLL